MNILKPKVYNGFDPTGWWMAEKLDGVRAEWDATGPEFMSKNDKHYYVPDQKVAEMPTIPFLRRLSGEFYLGRGRFQETVSIVRNQRMDMDEWDNIQYMIFELPIETYLFEERQNILNEYRHRLPFWCHIIQWFPVNSPEHFEEFYDDIICNSGEGVVLAKAESPYIFGRSSNQWKRTPTFTAEATVIGHTPGTGKHEGRCGALEVIAMPFNVNNRGILKFKVGTGLSDEQRENPPKLNSVITYSYKGLTSAGKPRHPAFLTVRDYE
jgi:DNA ligase-1